MRTVSRTLRIQVAALLACVCLPFAGFAAEDSAGSIAESGTSTADQSQLECRDVGLTGVTTVMGDFCIKTSGEMTARLVAQKKSLASFNARLMYDARLLSQDQYIRAFLALDVTVDSPDVGADQFDGTKSELFVEYEDVLVGRAETIIDAGEPLSYLKLPIGWKNPDYRTWQLRYAPTLGIFKVSFAVEALENAWKSGEEIHYAFNAKSSEIWGELSISHLSRPVFDGSAPRGYFSAATATVPIPAFVGTKVRIGAAYTDKLVSYFGAAADDLTDSGWSAFISGEHLIGDDVTLAATFGKTSTKNAGTVEALGVSVTYEPDFDTIISGGITYNLTNHQTETGIKIVHQFNETLEITVEAKKYSAAGFAAILELKSSF